MKQRIKHLNFIVGLLFGIVILSCQKAPVLTITGPTNIELNADGSTGTITFTANRDWTISTSDSWVSVSPSSGAATDGQVTVTVRCGANTTYEDRTATVTIRMDELTQTVSVRQPANLGIVLPTQSYNLESDARTIDVEVQANVQYTVSTSVNWIKQTGTKGLTSTKYTFSIEENTTYDSREGTITIKSLNSSVPDQVITVKQAQKDALIIKDKSFDMPYGGGEIEFKVEANVDFDVKPDVDWIHYMETKALSNSTVRLTVDENPTYAAREGKIEIKQKSGSLSHTITVKEAGRIAVTSITLDQTSLTLKPEETATLVATVKPDNATDKTVTWSSSDSNVATVDESGKVAAVKIGGAIITAKAGEKTTECVVTVCIPVTSIELDKTNLVLKPGEKATLVAIIKPDDATDKTVTWDSSDSEIVTVDENGNVIAIKDGSATITAKIGEYSATCSVTVKTPVYVGNAVDLGIVLTREDGTSYKLYWADCNLGTDKPEEYGDYYAWGEKETKTSYSISNYKWANGDLKKLTKYCPTDKTEFWDGTGSPDGKTVLDLEDDVAHFKLGGKWRMPTFNEFGAMQNQCIFTWTVRNGVYGYEIKNKNASESDTNSIFLPAAGKFTDYVFDDGIEGNYWTSTLYDDGPSSAYEKIFPWPDGMTPFGRGIGCSIRPVLEEDIIDVTSIELSMTSFALSPGETTTLIATVAPDNATDKTVSWTSSDASIASVDKNGIVTAIKDGSATITAKVGEKSVECYVLVGSAPDGAVNLGIVVTREDGTKYALYWAECNIGASSPEEFGDYYAWGEIEPNNNDYYGYWWNTYKWCVSSNQLLKYCTEKENWWNNTKPDCKMVLDLEDDVAHVKLGGKWRIPTKKEVNALIESTTVTKKTINGVKGYEVYSTVNGNSIFLPAAGYKKETNLYFKGDDCFGWTSVRSAADASQAEYFYYGTRGNYGDVYPFCLDRCIGLPIRPISE